VATITADVATLSTQTLPIYSLSVEKQTILSLIVPKVALLAISSTLKLSLLPLEIPWSSPIKCLDKSRAEASVISTYAVREIFC
jgi:hypothetical protein